VIHRPLKSKPPNRKGSTVTTETAVTAAVAPATATDDGLSSLWESAFSGNKLQRATWMPRGSLRLSNNHVEWVVPNLFAKEWVTEHHLAHVREAAQRILRKEVLLVQAASHAEYDHLVPRPTEEPTQAKDLNPQQPTQPRKLSKYDFVSACKTVINPDNAIRFANLCVHPGNEAAIEWAVRVSDEVIKTGRSKEGASFIGPNGVGKTAIVASLMNALLEAGLIPAYVSPDRLSSDFQLKKGAPPNWLVAAKGRLSSCPPTCVLLAIDGLADLEPNIVANTSEPRRPGTKAAILDLWEYATCAEIPIICTFTGDATGFLALKAKVAETNKDLADRLGRNSFLITPPQKKERRGLIAELIKRTGKAPSDDELARVAKYLDDVMPDGTSLRDIVGFYVGILSNTARKGAITIQLAAAAFGQMCLFDPTAYLKQDPRRILELPEKMFPDIPIALLIGEEQKGSRGKDVKDARALLMFVTRELTGESLDRIGGIFGGRHHTTVLNAITKFAKSLNTETRKSELLERACDLLTPRK